MSKSGKASKKTNAVNNSEENSTSNAVSSAAAPVYRYKDVNFANAEVSELNKEGRQPLAYINNKDPVRNAETKILVQTEKIKITSHGIPQLDKEDKDDGFYPDDSKREFIKVPLDPEQPACVNLRKHLEGADAWAGSSAMRKKLFGKRADEYQYQPSIKTPQKPKNDDDDDDDKPKKGKGKNVKGGVQKKEYPIIDYVKMKFNVVTEGKGRVNKTKLKKVDGKTKTIVKADTITEVANEVNFLSECRFVFYYNKIWANKTPAQGATKIVYGLGFKVMAIEYTPGAKKGFGSADIDFLSEEDEDEEKPAKKTTNSKGKPAPKLDDSDDDENNEEDEDDDKPKKGTDKSKPKVESKGKGKNSKKADSEDEDNDEADDDEEEISAKKASPKKGTDKKSKKADDDEEDDDDEEISAKKVPSKKGADKKSKKADEDEEAEDDDEEVPIKKAGKKGTDKKSKKAKDEDEDEEDEEAEEEIKPKKRPAKGKSTSRSNK